MDRWGGFDECGGATERRRGGIKLPILPKLRGRGFVRRIGGFAGRSRTCWVRMLASFCAFARGGGRAECRRLKSGQNRTIPDRVATLSRESGLSKSHRRAGRAGMAPPDAEERSTIVYGLVRSVFRDILKKMHGAAPLPEGGRIVPFVPRVPAGGRGAAGRRISGFRARLWLGVRVNKRRGVCACFGMRHVDAPARLARPDNGRPRRRYCPMRMMSDDGNRRPASRTAPQRLRGAFPRAADIRGQGAAPAAGAHAIQRKPRGDNGLPRTSPECIPRNVPTGLA